MSIDAIITAGGIPKPDDDLYELTQGQSKALIDVAGKPMVQWVLDALDKSTEVRSAVIVGLDESAGLSFGKPLNYLPNQGGMLNNIIAATRKVAELHPDAQHILIVSSDIPTIQPEMVDWVVTQTRPEDDVVFNVIERSAMEARFPNSQRTFTKLKGIEVCGGDMNVASVSTILAEDSVWQQLAEARKSPLRQASIIGFDVLLLLLLRLVDIDAAGKRVSRNLGIRGRGALCPYPEIAMDVDRRHHLETIKRHLKD